MKSSFIQEFKEFAVKGNAIDMAVGVINYRWRFWQNCIVYCKRSYYAAHWLAYRRH